MSAAAVRTQGLHPWILQSHNHTFVTKVLEEHKSDDVNSNNEKKSEVDSNNTEGISLK